MRRFTILMAFLLIACSLALHAQGTQIKGKVTSSEDGSTLPGATVMVTGTTIVTVTDADGNYTLNLPPEAKAITVSFVGMKTKEIQIGGQAVINIILEPEAKNIEEVVVTAMGLKRSEKSLGYSATQVSSEEIAQSKQSSVLNSLEGKAAGVNVSSASGAPGASTKIILRGYSTLRGANQPLFIVDGIAVNNDQVGTTAADNTSQSVDFGNRVNDINPDDIESVNIYKGAAASALYGSRGANGVVVITTKHGKASEKINVDFSSNVAFSSILRYPQYQEMFGQGWNGKEDLTQNGSWGPLFDGKDRVWGNVVDNSQLLKPYVGLPTNYQDFWEIGKTFNNSLSLSGGNEKANFYTSYSNESQDGIVPGPVDSYKRNTVTLNGSTSGKRIKITGSASYINKQQRFVPTNEGGAGSTAAPTLYGDIIQVPNDLSILDMKDYNNKFYNLDNYYTPYAGNPYRSLNENGSTYNEDRVIGNILIEYNFAKWLVAHYRLGTDVSNGQRKDWNAIEIPNPKGYNGSYAPVYGMDLEEALHNQELNSNFYLTSDNKLNEHMNLNLLGGFEAVQIYHDYLTSQITNLTVPYFYNLDNTSGTPNTYTDFYKKRIYGFYAQAEYSYKEYLYITANGRNDRSSTLPIDHNSYLYGGISVGFIFTDALPSLKNVFSFGKLRASIARTGNDADPYETQNVFKAREIDYPLDTKGEILKFPLNGQNAYTIDNVLGNPNLKPEFSNEWEVGGDLRFLNNRIGIDADYYDKKSTDIILQIPLAGSTGFTSQYQNAGSIENKGVELTLTLVPLKFSNFSWDMSFKFDKNQGKLVSLNDTTLKKIIINGAGVNYQTVQANLVAKPGEPLGIIEGPGPVTDGKGHIVVGATGMPLLSPDPIEYGNTQAKYNLKISNTFKFENLTLGCLFDIREGGIMYSGTANLVYFVGNATQSLYNYRQPFIVPNSVTQPIDPTTKKPEVDVKGNPVYVENSTAITMNNMQDYYYFTNNPVSLRNQVIDRSYIKLREVSLFYTLPAKWLANSMFKTIELGFVGRNLLLWTPKSNNFVDPETTNFGNDLASEFGEFLNSPSVRSFNFSVKASF